MSKFYGNQHVDPDRDSYEELLEKIETLAAELDRPPTTEDATNDDRFPSIATLYRILDVEWMQALRDAGVEPGPKQVSTYTEKDRKRMVEDLRRAAKQTPGETLTTREYDEVGEYTSGTIKDQLGSWSNACETSGITPGSRYGKSCVGPNGNTLDSYHELRAATILDQLDLQYETHPPVPESDWVADFYVPSTDLWIEVDGFLNGDRPNEHSFKSKLEHYSTVGLNHLVVRSDESIRDQLKRHPDLANA